MSPQVMLEALIRSEQMYGLIETISLFCGAHINVRIPFSLSLCETSIDGLQLSARSQNALMRAGLFTVDRVMDAISQNGLTGIRNLGAKSLREIKTKMLILGFNALSDSGKRRFFKDLIDLNPSMLHRFVRLEP